MNISKSSEIMYYFCPLCGGKMTIKGVTAWKKPAGRAHPLSSFLYESRNECIECLTTEILYNYIDVEKEGSKNLCSNYYILGEYVHYRLPSIGIVVKALLLGVDQKFNSTKKTQERHFALEFKGERILVNISDVYPLTHRWIKIRE